jgi:hypothetical protein
MAFIHYFSTLQNDSGTWTPLNTPTSDIAKNDPNVPQAFNLNPLDFQTVPTEFEQFIHLVGKGYNIGYWPALCLLEKFILALKNRTGQLPT